MKDIEPPWNRSIRYKTIIPLIAAFLAAAGMMTGFVVSEAQRTVERILGALRAEMVLRVSSTLDGKLHQAIQLSHLHRDALRAELLRIADHRMRERYFVTTLRQYENVAMTFIGMPDGAFYGARRLRDGSLQVVRNNANTQGHSERC